MNTGSTESLGAAVTALIASSSTLVCCVLPAALVSLGAGAAVVGLVAVFPQLIWLSEHKAAVFGVAAALLALSGLLLWWALRQPCPIDRDLGLKCMRLRRFSAGLYSASVGMLVLSSFFAFVLPRV